MAKISLPIDTKSLYYNIFNDNIKGHTCTVATPIKQGNSFNQDLQNVFRIPCQVNFQEFPDLIDVLTKNSKSVVKINNVFVFSKLKVNGVPLDVDSSFCFFVKEEIDPNRVQFGRIKLHYPMSLNFRDLNIDNKSVINAISEQLNNYAFIVYAFEYDFDDNSLNFKLTIVGYPQIPYSKVFLNFKGVGSKFTKLFEKYNDNYDREIVSLRKNYGEEVNAENYHEFINHGMVKAQLLVKNYLLLNGVLEINFLSQNYPYSIFDAQYDQNGVTQYLIIKFTYSTKFYLDLSSDELRALNLISNTHLLFICNLENSPKIIEFSKDELTDLKHEIRLIRLTKYEE